MLFLAEGPLGRTIRLTKKRFTDHIEADHAELAGQVGRLKRAIEDPESVDEERPPTLLS